MEFRTQIPIPKVNREQQIDYNSNVMLLGSCFAQNIGHRFDYFKLPSVMNPFGILFHPKAIATFIERVVHEKKYKKSDLVEHNELFHCLDAHSVCSGENSTAVIEALNQGLIQTKESLESTSHVIITLGTSWAYWHKEKEHFVANCHKIPQKAFEKVLLSPAQIVESLQTIESLIRTSNPEVKFVYTVSPVRHSKDGFIENQRSKAHLLTAIHEQIESSSSSLFYFPSYEIVMDELRDYRFYADDMIHPNQTAVAYIWEQFKNTWIDEATYPIMKRVDIIQKGLAHKPFNPDSEQHQKFVLQLRKKIEAIQQDVPGLVF